MCWNLFLIGCRPEGVQLYQKETPTEVFSCEHCEIFKNTYFEKHLRANGYFCRIRILWPSVLGNYIVCKRFAVQNLQRSLEFVIYNKFRARHQPSLLLGSVEVEPLQHSS